MPEAKTCSACGAEMPAAGPCPNCLLALALGDEAGKLPDPTDERRKAGAVAQDSAGQAGCDSELGCAQDSFVPTALVEKEGDTIGRYKLLQKLGEGGCGVVYLAEQHEPVHRRVALKVIKLGMDTRQVIARFEAERQALALMDHPNIARVLDAGATEAGRPYFVMELVKGIPLTRFCDENRLSTSQRLTLFTQICHAIQHAHQKGIVHRDIKPSNILVTDHEGAAMPKVIDFGIAKATTDQPLTDKTLFTAFEQFMGTPAYMSPEQARLSGADVDTRSDIYSLGVLLYELLTGKTPFDSTRLRQAGFDEIRRIIREEEPPKPSTRLSTLADDEQTKLAGCRQAEPPKLVSLLRGDLDWIVMKALEKDRSRRYETANGLAGDVQRHLNNEPVVARPPSKTYQFQKFVGRNKLAFAAGTAVVVSLAAGLAISTVMYFKQKGANARASEQAAIAEAVNNFLMDDLLSQADSRSQAEAKFQPDPNLTVREALERAANHIGDRFTNQLVEAAVRQSIGTAMIGVAQPSQALLHLERAVDLRKANLGPDHPDTLTSMSHLALACLEAGKIDQALRLSTETFRLRTARLGPDDPDTLTSMNNLAQAYREAGKLDQALPLFEETLKRRRAKLGAESPTTLTSMNNLAAAYRDAGKLDQALALYDETLSLRKARLGPDNPDTLTSMNNLALALLRAGKLKQALPLLEETLTLRKARLGPDHRDTLTSMNNLARAYQEAGKIKQAIPLFEEALKLFKAKLGPDHRDTLALMNNLAAAYQRAGKLDLAIPLFEESYTMLKTRLGADHPTTLRTMNNLGLAYQSARRLDQAVPLLEETLKARRVKLGADHPDTLNTLTNLASAYRDANQQAKADELFKK